MSTCGFAPVLELVLLPMVSFRIVLISKALSVVLSNTEGKAYRERECLQQSLLKLYLFFPPLPVSI